MQVRAKGHNLCGLACCAILLGGCVASFDGADTHAARGAPERALPERAHFVDGMCATDEIRERLCGFLASPVDVAADAPFWDCPADPKQLTSAGPTMLFYSDTKRLSSDQHLTVHYREELNEKSRSPDDERKGQCCFSRCTPIQTAERAARAVPSGYEETALCVDAPQGGTAAPAAEFPECPNAIHFGLAPLADEADPFDAVETAALRTQRTEFFHEIPRCCYRVLQLLQ